MRRETLLAIRLVKRRAARNYFPSGNLDWSSSVGLWVSPSGEPTKVERGKFHDDYVINENGKLVLRADDPEGVNPMDTGWGRVRLYGGAGQFESYRLNQKFVDVISDLAMQNLVEYWVLNIRTMRPIECSNDDLKTVSTPTDVFKLGRVYA